MRKRVFVSYAHKDAANFVARLTASLEMYVDTFWDIKLQAGEFSPQLEQKITECDFFLVVMSHAQSESRACKWELEKANENNRVKVPIKVFDKHKDDELEKLQYADFTESFDEGFRILTDKILGERLSSWEYLGQSDDQNLLESLSRGAIPAVIAKTVAEWAIVDKLWIYIDELISEHEIKQTTRILRGTPRTPAGILRQCGPISDQFRELRNQSALYFVGKACSIVATFQTHLKTIRDDHHLEAGLLAFSILTNIHNLMNLREAARLDARSLITVQAYFYFDVAEKLRELIVSQARRSRYLY